MTSNTSFERMGDDTPTPMDDLESNFVGLTWMPRIWIKHVHY
jgi:hypothetical protein